MRVKLTFSESNFFLANKHKLNTINKVLPTSSKHDIGEMLEFYDFANNHLGNYFIVQSETFRLDCVTPSITFPEQNLPVTQFISLYTGLGSDIKDHFDNLTLNFQNPKSYD